MRKKKRFFIRVNVFDSAFLMEINVYRVSQSWKIDYEGVNLASIYGRKVENRDKMIKNIEIYVEKPLKEYMTSFSLPDLLDKYISIEWEFVDVTNCSANTFYIREAVNSFFRKPENVKRLSVAKTSQRFGL